MRIRVFQSGRVNPLIAAVLVIVALGLLLALVIFGLTLLAGLTLVGGAWLLGRRIARRLRGEPPRAPTFPTLDPSREVFSPEELPPDRQLPPT
jgi:hypothetical protein